MNIFYMKYLFFFLLSSISFSCLSQEFTWNGTVESHGFLSNEELPFWMFTNTNGRIGSNTNGEFYTFAKANYELSKNSTLEFGASGIIRDGIDPNAQRSEIYLAFKNSWIHIIAGSKDQNSFKDVLSTTNQNILFSGNTRALPGLLFQNSKPIRIFKNISFDLGIAHYQLNDDRFVNDTRVHYKKFFTHWKINSKNKITVGLQHVAQWGGTSPTRGEQPGGFSDFVDVFFGRGGGDNATLSDQVNVLGNHLGSYTVNYKRKEENYNLEVYYHTIFEDRSGIELNNFPDGVWGLFYTPKESTLFKGLLYEYVQTISQSGSPIATQNGNQQSGGDNYFFNGAYRSGWTYEGRTIGLPFINIGTGSSGETFPINNRSIAHHLGVLGSFWKLDYTLKLTYLENLGTFRNPITPRDTFVYTYLETRLPLEKLGTISLEIGADFNENRDTFFGAGLGYSYKF